MNNRRNFMALALLVASLIPALARAEALYTINVLPDNFYPVDINNAGQIAGSLNVGDGHARAAIYANGVVTDLGTFGGIYSDIAAINDAGTVAGNLVTTAGDGRAFFYGNGRLVEIAGLYAQDINASGDIAGQARTASGYAAALYSQGALTSLGYLGTGDFSTATAVNDAGHVVGTSTIDPDFHSRQHPFLYNDGVLHDLGTLDEREFNSAVAINNAGQIAGYSEGANGGMHAFLYEDGVMTDLGSFGGRNLHVGGMNWYGDIVGAGQTWDGPDVAFISRGGTLVDLNTLIDPAAGWTIADALGINDLGQIIATACNALTCSAVRLDLASAVPEPGGAALLAAGLLTMPGLRRRQKRTRKKAAVPGGYGGFDRLLRGITRRGQRVCARFLSGSACAGGSISA